MPIIWIVLAEKGFELYFTLASLIKKDGTESARMQQGALS
jgi:hypothetical protein